MEKRMDVSESIRYTGVDDTTIDLFESQYPVPTGVSYNSYVILDEKITVMDTCDKRGSEQWMKNVKTVLGGRKPDYLVVQHLEPDHSANIAALADEYPDMQLVGSYKTKQMIAQFFEKDYASRMIAVKEGETLSLGSHTLHFVMAPMVHWPEVMVTYEDSEKVLFSADGFGTFGALSTYADWTEDEWLEEARRYYINIVGKYGTQVLALLNKAASLDIAKIAPLHGPVLSKNLGFYIGKYQTWASYEPEESGIFFPYASIHGNTKKAVLDFVSELQKKGANVIPMDLTRTDVSYAVEKAYEYDRMILAGPTYDAGLFPCVEDFIYHLEHKLYQNRTVGLIENGSWAPQAGKLMTARFSAMKNITLVQPVVTIKTTRKAADQAAWDVLAEEMLK